MPKIKIIAGSNRPGRFNIQPASWLADLAEKLSFDAELVDLEKLNLPFCDEAVPASYGKYEKDHTKKWAKIVGEADGFVFVTPEYNHSYSAILKNAIDYIYGEWNFKPVAFLSYGSQAGGGRAVEHLRAVAGELKMYDIREQVMFSNYWENLDENGQFKFNDSHAKSAEAMLESLVFWADSMKGAREKMFNKAKPTLKIHKKVKA